MNIKLIKKISLKIALIATIFLIVAFVLILSFHFSTEGLATWSPNYEKVDLTYLENKTSYSEEEYALIYIQTGLGKPAVDAVKNSRFTLTDYQEDFFQEKNYLCEKIGVITFEEKSQNIEGKNEKAFRIADLQEGDVLITKNTHSLGWRHGHSAIVVDGQGGKTLEAVLWGEDSVIQRVEKWHEYPSVIVLRPKEGIDGNKVARNALRDMEGIPYGLFTGIPRKAPDSVGKTQCAHLIWYPYFQAGCDVDSDGGWLVTPKDIANSEFFQVVQVYGVNPRELWQ